MGKDAARRQRSVEAIRTDKYLPPAAGRAI
jgi:hypothetical protein